MITCGECSELKPHHANGRCKQCYDKRFQKAYHTDHRDDIIARQRAYYEDHKDGIAAQQKAYRAENPKEQRNYVTAAGQCSQLNNRFDGCRRHHVDDSTIIHIPIEMHVTNPHNIRTGRGMARINALAFAFLNGQREASAQTTLTSFA